ncbi:alpha/beta hydrolase [Aeromicrobium sp.]
MPRSDVRFPSGPQMCAGWWYEPTPAAPRGPVIVMAHGLGAVKEMRLDAYAERFTDQGYRVLVFDYRHFGESEGLPRELIDIERQLDDWAAALHYVRALPTVDKRSIVLWGTSFSGGHVIEVARRDPEVAAVISQCPFTDGLASARTLRPVSLLKVSVLAIRDALRGLTRRAPVRIDLVGRRGQVALLNTPDAYDGYLSLVPEGMNPPIRVPARIALRILLYYPGRSAAQLDCPALFCVSNEDSVAPSRTTLRHVRKARRGQIRRYDVGHFDLYVGDAFEQVVADQIRFLKEIVPVETVSG